jgi:multiple sugar transport system permease protein
MKKKFSMKIKYKEALAGYAFTFPHLLGFVVFFAIPTIISIYYCFTAGVSEVRFVGLENFKSLLKSSSYILAVKNTLIFNAISIPLIMILSFLFALLLNKALRGMEYFRMFFLLPLVIPIASVIQVWRTVFDGYGVLNCVLNSLNIKPVDWLGTNWSMAVLVLLYIWKNCGYNIILFTAGLNSIPKEYYEAASIDGADGFKRLWKITLPLVIPTGFFVFIISMINSFKVFREAYLLGGDYPHQKIYMLQHFMNNNFTNLNYQRLSTASVLMGVFIVFLVYILYKFEGKNNVV